MSPDLVVRCNRSSLMSPGLRALLAGVIDYAGLFPPAKLPLDQAIRNYARYRREPDSWMLGRFICPAARLAELEPFVVELFGDGPPLGVSVLGRGGKDAADFLDGLRQDLADITAFRGRHGTRVTAELYEVRLPADGVNGDLGRQVAQLFIAVGPPVLIPYFEAAPTALSNALSASAGFEWAVENKRLAGFKLRCCELDVVSLTWVSKVAIVV